MIYMYWYITYAATMGDMKAAITEVLVAMSSGMDKVIGARRMPWKLPWAH